jgi:exodeoxyribonuclease VII large subunit
MELAASSPRKVMTVAELSRKIKSLLEDNLRHVWVTGQVSRVVYARSGHLYFDLKDEEQDNAVISVTMWRPRVDRLRFRVETGMSVLVYGLVTAYAAQGRYQISAEEIEPKGVGALHLKFEQLKEKLREEGLFDEDRKRPLPPFPRTVAIVTSPVGAAVQDMIKTISTRHPRVSILVLPVKVQGAGAAEEIASAIARLNLARPDVDVMIVGRGGGSLEDLWAFNEEVVARAVAASRIPVVSAVGHETDHSISDFVADVRALTPTDAGMMVVPRLEELELSLEDLSMKLRRALRHRAELARSNLDRLRDGWELKHPENLVVQHRQRMDELEERLRTGIQGASAHLREKLDDQRGRLPAALAHHAVMARTRLDGLAHSWALRQPEVQVGRLRDRCRNLEPHMEKGMTRIRERALARTKQLEGRLASLNPKAVLERGYSITRLEDGTVLRSADQAADGSVIQTDLAKGRITSRVEKKK